MDKKHEFYPMISRTVKELIAICETKNESSFLVILQNYPDIQFIDKEFITPVNRMLINELDRQYTRWNKGCDNGTQI